VSPAYVTLSRYVCLRIEDDVTSPEHALVIQGGSLGGLGGWIDVCNLKTFCLRWAVTVF
jgi:hypothetical protein